MTLSTTWQERTEGWPSWALRQLEGVLVRAAEMHLTEEDVYGFWRTAQQGAPELAAVLYRVADCDPRREHLVVYERAAWRFTSAELEPVDPILDLHPGLEGRHV